MLWWEDAKRPYKNSSWRKHDGLPKEKHFVSANQSSPWASIPLFHGGNTNASDIFEKFLLKLTSAQEVLSLIGNYAAQPNVWRLQGC